MLRRTLVLTLLWLGLTSCGDDGGGGGDGTTGSTGAATSTTGTTNTTETTTTTAATTTATTGGATDSVTTGSTGGATGTTAGDSSSGTSTGVATHTLTVERLGAGNGGVLSAPEGIVCGTTCSAEFDEGTVVTLTGMAPAQHEFVGWSGGGCAGTVPCEITITADVEVQATFEPRHNIVFITSSVQQGAALGGLTAADALCNSLASDASLPGTYQAWLSSSAEDAIDRLAATGARGWIRPDGRPFADSIASLIDDQVNYYPPRLDETEADWADDEITIMTATGQDGRLAFNETACADWTMDDAGTVRSGAADAGADGWTNTFQTSCTQESHVLCFGTDFSNPLVVTPVAGRVAFLSGATVGTDAGIDGFDTLCQSEADDAVLAGNFQAFVSTTAASAISRFNTVGATWVRYDGLPIVDAAGDLAGAANLLAPITYGPDGTLRDGQSGWTGASDPSSVGNLTCADWSDSTTGSGRRGMAGRTVGWMGTGPTSCDNTFGRVYCFEE